MKKKRINRRFSGDLAIFLFLLVGGLFAFIPMFFAITTSLKPFNELFIKPPRLFVTNPTLVHYKTAFEIMANSVVPFTRYVFNSFFITFIGTAFHILAASMCAYPLAKRRFPGQNIIFQTVVLALMFNLTVLDTPRYLVMRSLRLVDTYWAMILPAVGSALGLYLMKQFMNNVPTTIIEAAKIDGARELNIFWSIVMPQVKPAWLTLMLFSVQTLWNAAPSAYVFSDKIKPLTTVFLQITGSVARQGVASAISVMLMSVPITVFIITQSKVIETMTSSGIKE